MRTKPVCSALAVYAAISGFGNPVNAQKHGPPPTSGDCTSYASAVSSGSRDWGQWGRIAACGTVGGNALAAALQAAVAETDTLYLGPFLSVLYLIRDSAVTRVARNVALNSSASVQARTMALAAGLAQYDNSMIAGPGFGPMLAATESNCPVSPFGIGHFYESTTVSQGSAVLAAAVLDSVYYSSAPTPAPLRSFARCLRIMLTDVAPLRVPNSAITLEYVCGNRFKVQNSGREYATVGYGTPNGALVNMTVPPGGAQRFTTSRVQNIQLSYFGVVIRTASNAGTICP